MNKVDWTKWSAIAEILSAIAIVVTLIYLADQTNEVRVQTEQNFRLLTQEAEVAQTERYISYVEGMRYWAELLSANANISNAEIWEKGRAGQPLSSTEHLVFYALAAAWEADLWQRWFFAESAPNVLFSSPGERYVKEFALSLEEHPGLSAFWEQHKERMSLTLGDPNNEWERLVEEELIR